MVDISNVREVSYLDASGYILSRALIDISTGIGYDRNMPSKSVRLQTNEQGVWYELKAETIASKPVKEEPKKAVAVIEIREPEKVMAAIFDVVAQSAFNDGVGPNFANAEDVREESLDEAEIIVWDVYKKIKEQI